MKPRRRRHSPVRPPQAHAPAGVAEALLPWYDRHKRDLPWRRREHDGYAQLVAELMLQQTQVATVVAYYRRFMERFPTVEVLARAELGDVLALWAGLGYYSRARNLHAAAMKIACEHGGQVPESVEALMDLPGVGRYTAGAVASIAFGARAPVLDGNVARVLLRLMALDADPKAPATRTLLWEAAERLLPVTRCGDFNQALMELGATVCVPSSPNCLLCPLRTMCHASLSGRVDRIPRPAARARVLDASVLTAAVAQGDAWYFVRRPDKGLWAGLWELPTEPVAEGEAIRAAKRRLRRRLPPGVRLASRAAGTVQRTLTHRLITFHVLRGSASRAGAGGDGRWLTEGEARKLGISRACEAILAFLKKPEK